MGTLTTILSFLTTILKALVPLGAYMLGKKNVEKEQLRESVDAARDAKRLQDDIALLPESELDERLRKYTRK